MKNNLLKFYITAFFLCSTFVTFAETPGTEDETGNGNLENVDALPINDYVWVLAAIGIVYVFLRLATFSIKQNAPKA